MVKNCDLGLENTPRSQFFTIRTSQPANNIYLFRMYCVVTRSSLRPFCDQNFGKYVYMANFSET